MATNIHPFSVPRVGVSVLIKHPNPKEAGKLQFLLGKRMGSHGAGTWGLPGGHIDLGETIDECARREVEEETGLDITNIEFLTATTDIFYAAETNKTPTSNKESKNTTIAKHYITLFVTATVVPPKGVSSGEPWEPMVKLREPKKCAAWEWFSWERIKEADSREVRDDEDDALELFLPIKSLINQRWDVVREWQ